MSLDQIEVHLRSMFPEGKDTPKKENPKNSLSISWLLSNLEKSISEMNKRLQKSEKELKKSEQQ